jgi:hypothetical protein
VGIIGLLVALIPCIGWTVGLPVAGLGLLLGGAGLIVALVRNGKGLGFPISGTAVSLVAIIVACVWLYVAHRLVTHANRDIKPQMEKMANDLQEAMKKAQLEAQKNQNQQPVPDQPALARTILERRELLNEADPEDKVSHAPSKSYSVKLEAGKSYQIDLTGPRLLMLVRLENEDGREVASARGPGPSRSATITWRCEREGIYRVIATTAAGQRIKTGSFRLAVQQK